MDFEKICVKYAMTHQYYGILLSAMRKIPLPKHILSTLGVARSGNVFILGYNPDYIESLSYDEVDELLTHEMLHLCFHHLTMWDEGYDGVFVNECVKDIKNIAEDLEVNCYLKKDVIRKLKGFLPSDYGLPEKLGAREYFKRLMQMSHSGGNQQDQQQQQPSQNQNQQQNQSGQGQNQNQQQTQQQGSNQSNDQPSDESSQNKQKPDNGLPNTGSCMLDDHSKWPQDMEDLEVEGINSQIDDLMNFAAEEVEKSCGEIPGEVKGRIEKIRKKPRPVTDWRRYFRRFCGNEFSEQIKKSKKRESKRFPDAAGNRHKRKSHILVGIDTSGSVSMPEYREFMGQIKTLAEKATFHVVECDTRIQYEYDYNGKCNEILHGGGGTSFYPVVDLFLKSRRKYDALVYFTDGYCTIPNNTPKETLWVISSKGDHDRNKYKVNGATSVFIQEKSVR